MEALWFVPDVSGQSGSASRDAERTSGKSKIDFQKIQNSKKKNNKIK
jgi:hypothetical protein